MTEPALTPRGRSAFDRFAEEASNIVSGAPFFAACALVVLLWLPTIVVFSDVDTWQLVINTATSVLAFLLVALLQNSERRSDRAMSQKLDVVAAGLADLLALELEARDHEALRRRVSQLREAIRLEEEI
jgi:low affinity Fe/Cu permease